MRYYISAGYIGPGTHLMYSLAFLTERILGESVGDTSKWNNFSDWSTLVSFFKGTLTDDDYGKTICDIEKKGFVIQLPTKKAQWRNFFFFVVYWFTDNRVYII
jgi:hypothetical protein